jgi:hypothetical protein
MIAQPDSASTDNLFRGRIVVEVKADEQQQISTASLIDGTDTKVFIDITEEGYFWVNDNY